MAIALRNRWRRQQVDENCARDHAQEHPDDRAHRRRQDRDRAPPARLADAPFIKVEATKFTEVGYVGKDVDTDHRDLADMAVKQEREAAMRRQPRAEDAAEERILDAAGAAAAPPGRLALRHPPADNAAAR